MKYTIREILVHSKRVPNVIFNVMLGDEVICVCHKKEKAELIGSILNNTDKRIDNRGNG